MPAKYQPKMLKVYQSFAFFANDIYICNTKELKVMKKTLLFLMVCVLCNALMGQSRLVMNCMNGCGYMFE